MDNNECFSYLFEDSEDTDTEKQLNSYPKWTDQLDKSVEVATSSKCCQQ